MSASSSVGIRTPEFRPALHQRAMSAGLARHGAAVPRADTLPNRLDEFMLTEILEELDHGVIVCAEDGKVLLANDAARRELQREAPLRVDQLGQLQVATGTAGQNLALRGALRLAIQARRRQLLPLGAGADALMVSVMPLGFHPRPLGMVLLGRRRPAPELAVDMLATQCKLTDAERSVLRGLLAGQRVEALARERKVKLCTLRTQVAALRAKLGVARLDDLVRMASELPPMTGALRCPPLRTGAAAPVRDDAWSDCAA